VTEKIRYSNSVLGNEYHQIEKLKELIKNSDLPENVMVVTPSDF